MSIKNPKASRALKLGRDPGRSRLAQPTQLRFTVLVAFGLGSRVPLDQILDPQLPTHLPLIYIYPIYTVKFWTHPPPSPHSGSKFFYFHAIFGKFWQNPVLTTPPIGLVTPPPENPGSATTFKFQAILLLTDSLFTCIHLCTCVFT